MSFVIPVHRIKETAALVAFYHPSPSYPVHILIVPKKAIPSLSDLSHLDGNLMLELFSTVKDLVEELDLEEAGYRLIANGGAYQEVPQLHFHLVSEHPAAKDRKSDDGR
jgi:histidine triad (HIT) family protein